MSIEINAPEVFALADMLRSSSGDAEAITGTLAGAPPVGGGLQSAVECFLESHRTAAHALAGGLQWLGGAFATVADSWLLLDARLLAPGDRASAE
jgi:transglutaminase-like putative cysteine protease